MSCRVCMWLRPTAWGECSELKVVGVEDEFSRASGEEQCGRGDMPYRRQPIVLRRQGLPCPPVMPGVDEITRSASLGTPRCTMTQYLSDRFKPFLGGDKEQRERAHRFNG